MTDITTLKGWRQYVNAEHERPAQVSLEELRRMPPEDRAAYNEARAAFSQAGSFIRTSQFRTFERAVKERIMLNTHRHVGKLGAILSGEPGQGKTTSLVEVGRAHELRRRATNHPAAREDKIPVVYVAVPAQCSAKALMSEFARFVGLPVLPRMTYGNLLDMVANALHECSTELILIDDVHHLDLNYRQNIEASDMLKQLSERCGGTFAYAGIDIETSGLLVGTRQEQIRKRFELHLATPFGRTTREEQADWGDLLLSLESSLCLAQQRRGEILRAAETLHSLTAGEIGLLKDLLHVAALRAIEDESERLDLVQFERDLKLRETAAQMLQKRSAKNPR